MSKHDELVTGLFTKYVKPMGLPPRLAGQIKHAMTAAADESKGDRKVAKKAIAAYLTERGYDPETGKKVGKPTRKAKPKTEDAKPAKVKKTKKGAPAKEDSDDKPKKKLKTKEDDSESTSKDPVRKTLKKKAPEALAGDANKDVPKGNANVKVLDRRTLKGMAKDLGVSYSKSMSDADLQANVAKTMIGWDDKLTKIIKDEANTKAIDDKDSCIGLFIDLTNAVCIGCKSQTECRQLFEAHRKDGFKVFDALTKTPLVDTEKTKADTVPAANLAKKAKKEPYNPERQIELYDFGKVKDLPLVEVDGSKVKTNMDHKEFLRALKEAVPETLAEFREVVLAHYEVGESDDEGHALTMWFARYAVALDIAKLI